ncbi:MAG: acetate--CoA ligase family protein [Gemmatimonadota bacterium]
MPRGLRPLFTPRSVALIGASRDPRKRGHQAVKALLEAGYRGRIIPVNPRGGEILGLAVVRRIEDLDEPPELAFVSTPAAAVPRVLTACGERGIRAAVVVAGGFREAGRYGAALEREMTAIARRSKLRVLGPNTSGLLNTRFGLNLVGVGAVRPGPIAVVSQSGNVGLDLMLEASENGPGISIYVGLGNEADVGAHEVLAFLARHQETEAILVYAEGFRDGKRFLAAARRTARIKPVVLLKGGRSQAGTAAARSHTGAIAGSAPVLAALLRQHGVVEVARSDEVLAVGAMLARQPPLSAGLGIGVLSDGGGHATLAADALAELGAPLASLDAVTRRRLRRALGSAAVVENPVDVAGAADRDPEVLARALEIVAHDRAVGGVLVVGLFGGYGIRFDPGLEAPESAAAAAMARTMDQADKPVVVHTLYARTRTAPLERLAAAGVPILGSIEIAARCMHSAYARGLALAREPMPPPPRLRPPRGAQQIIAAALAEGRDSLTEVEGRELVAAYGIQTVSGRFCRSDEEAAAAAGAAPGRVALKAVSPFLLHKSDVGAVELDIEGHEAAAGAFLRVVGAAIRDAEARRLVPDVRGVLVTEMLARPLAELLVGAHHDPQYGPLLTVATGGLAVELERDAAFRSLPVHRGEAIAMLDEIGLAPILRGYRGRPSADREAIVDVAIALSASLLSHPRIEAIELNPLFAYPDRAIAVDVRVTLRNTT